MAWNPSPEVAAVRDAAKRLNADRCVCIYTTADGGFGYASFGETKQLCDAAKGLAEFLYRLGCVWFYCDGNPPDYLTLSRLCRELDAVMDGEPCSEDAAGILNTIRDIVKDL